MAGTIVHVERDQFRRELLATEDAPLVDYAASNPFSALANAENLSGQAISEFFIQAVSTSEIMPGCCISPMMRGCDDPNDDSPKLQHAAIFCGPRRDRPCRFDQVVPISFYCHHPRADPFDPTQLRSGGETMNDYQTDIYDELSSSVELLFTAQHRVFLFMILVMGRRFRILRWDRAGVISTPSVDYFEQPTIACDYLYHLCRLGDDSLGFDPTATRLRPDDVDFLRINVAALPDAKDVDHSERDLSGGDVREPFTFAYIRSLFRTSLDCDWPRHRLVVQDGGQKHDYLVGKPTFHASGTMGRGTRGYVAYECSSRRFVWLKDAWRASYKITDREGDILAKLNAAKVTNVPTLICHGDVNNQTTITADWWERQSSLLSLIHASRAGSSRLSSDTSSDPVSLSGRKRKRADDAVVDTLTMQADGSMPHAIPETTGPLRQHTHYRVVVAEVCLPLKIFQYGRQLVSIVLDCPIKKYL
ncbi:hypothetical protein BD309DRAFT_361612 [Dichomitus squalens]|nr:hypothetical protein BD309DRAFT_361612 [Dichomitus squalens]